MFDQATSSLDMNNEILIQQTLQEIKGMMTIKVAHRVSTIKNFDIIFVIAEGRVIESSKFHQIQKFNNLSWKNFRRSIQIIKSQILKPLQKLKNRKLQSNNKIPQMQSSINFLCAMLTLLALGMLIINSINSSLFWVLSQNIALQMRIDTFKNCQDYLYGGLIIRKISNFLVNYQQILKYLVIQHQIMLSVLRIFTVIIFSIALGFYYDWKLTLISMAFLPFMFISSILQNRLLTQITNKMSKDAKKNLIHEGILNIRTLYSINGQYVIQKKYAEDLEQSYLDTVKKSHIVGLFFGISICSLYISTGLLFYISTLFVQHNNLSILDSIISRSAIISAGFSIITSIKSIPDFVSGKSAAISIFKLLGVEDEQEIQIRQKSRKLQQGFYRGNIEIKNLNFKYPQRNTDIFKNLNLSIQGGSKVAFVGQSGAGKSTILQLLLRFYEPQSGQILLDGINIKDFDLHYLRSIFGIVSQEPVLFNASFKQNIKYNQHSATQEDIIAVSKQASAYDFIEGNQKLENLVNQEENESILVKGFDRNVGIKGSHISGGQKQRVAIARVMLRKPKIILLDQATSALDKINEKLVQTALDKLMVNKTSITVAHRLDTIRNSDKIIVIKSGEIVQEGTYKSLVTLKGQLYNLERGAFINYSQ